jgi:tRNA threonylcarbamoyladenosine biosynthesis protein TsaE
VIRQTIGTPEEMARLGATIAAELDAGDVVALNGELGAGKTTLTRGLAEALRIRGTVTSPTFVLARTHPRLAGGPPLVHVDAYRLTNPAELDDLDIDFESSIVVVEWASGMLDSVVDSWLQVDIRRPVGGDATEDGIEPREVELTGHGDRWSRAALLGGTDAARH